MVIVAHLIETMLLLTGLPIGQIQFKKWVEISVKKMNSIND